MDLKVTEKDGWLQVKLADEVHEIRTRDYDALAEWKLALDDGRKAKLLASGEYKYPDQLQQITVRWGCYAKHEIIDPRTYYGELERNVSQGFMLPKGFALTQENGEFVLSSDDGRSIRFRVAEGCVLESAVFTRECTTLRVGRWSSEPGYEERHPTLCRREPRFQVLSDRISYAQEGLCNHVTRYHMLMTYVGDFAVPPRYVSFKELRETISFASFTVSHQKKANFGYLTMQLEQGTGIPYFRRVLLQMITEQSREWLYGRVCLYSQMADRSEAFRGFVYAFSRMLELL